MYQSIPFFGHIFLYFSLDFFYLSTQYICLLNLQCQRFQIFVFYTFFHALGAGYRRKAKALGKHCLYKYTNIGSRFRWIFVNLKTLISSNTIFEITLNFVIYFLFSESRKY